MKKKREIGGVIIICIIGIVAGVVMLLAGGLSIFNYFFDKEKTEETTEVPWFDLYSPSEELQGVEFLLISDSFSEYTYGTSQGFYLVYDEDMYGYIVYMENERVEGEFYANYEYTYNDIQKVPELGYVEGYAVEIDEELKEYAIEFFNVFWEEELLNEENFEDYLGSYYLDTTMELTSQDKNILLNIAYVILGFIVINAALTEMDKLFKRKRNQEEEKRQQILNYATENLNDSQVFGERQTFL